MKDNRLEEAIPLVFVFIVIAALFSYDSKNIWFLLIAILGSTLILGTKWLLKRGEMKYG